MLYSNFDLENSLKSLTEDGLFIINEIKTSENCFGNIIIKLHSKNLQIKLISEKNKFWCELGCEDELYFLEDVFTLLNISLDAPNNAFTDYVESISQLIISNYMGLLNLFSSKKLSTTKEKLQKIGMERARKMFGIN